MRVLSLIYRRLGVSRKIGCCARRMAAENVYIVPVPSELKSYARFKVENLTAEAKEGKLSIEFDLPIELTRIRERLRFVSSEQVPANLRQVTSKGQKGDLLCHSQT